MNNETADALRLDDIHELSCAELASLSGLSEAELREMADLGVLRARDLPSTQLMFGAECLVVARSAWRLRHDFELEPHALALVIKFSVRIQELEAELKATRAQLPGGFAD